MPRSKRLSTVKALGAATLLILAAATSARTKIEDMTLSDLARAMADGQTSSEAATRAYLKRIAALNHAGPRLNAVIAIAPDALAQARALDAERRAGHVRGPLHGIPILVKDNIETLGMPTTAGSLALKDNDNHRDAPLVAALKAQGALILGKTNLSEWANIRSDYSMSGWSAVGGLTRNPHALDRSTCGSSSGSGAAVSAGLAAGAVGTETNGSVICPSAMTGLVGLKPSIGLVPRTHVVPISHSQDTAGPMAHSVRDAAMLLSAMIASDPADPATRKAMTHAHDYAAALDPNAIRGMRITVLRRFATPALEPAFDRALERLRSAGAVLVPVEMPKLDGLGEAESAILMHELKADLNAYLASTDPARVKTRTLEELIAFNNTHAATEMPLFGQNSFIEAQKKPGLDDPAYRAALAKAQRLAGAEGIDAMLKAANAALIVTPSYGPAWPSDTLYGDQYPGPSASGLPAIAGYPHLTVPMDRIRGLPVGISFIGPRFSEQMLLNAGLAFEQASALDMRPSLRASADTGAELEPAR